MTLNLFKLIVVCCALLQIVHSDSNEFIECYKCKSNEFKECNDPFELKNVHLQTCRRHGLTQYGGHEYVKREFTFLDNDDTDNTDMNAPSPLDNILNPAGQGVKRTDNGDLSQTGTNPNNGLKYGQACYKVKLSGRDRDGEKIYPVVRSCLPDTPDLCDFIREMVERNNKGLLKVDFCQACYDNRCNGANTISFSIIAFISTVLFAVITM